MLNQTHIELIGLNVMMVEYNCLIITLFPFFFSTNIICLPLQAFKNSTFLKLIIYKPNI